MISSSSFLPEAREEVEGDDIAVPSLSQFLPDILRGALREEVAENEYLPTEEEVRQRERAKEDEERKGKGREKRKRAKERKEKREEAKRRAQRGEENIDFEEERKAEVEADAGNDESGQAWLDNKRPQNSFDVFRELTLKAGRPFVGKLVEEWKSLSKTQKQIYDIEAERRKGIYLLKHPDWKGNRARGRPARAKPARPSKRPKYTYAATHAPATSKEPISISSDSDVADLPEDYLTFRPIAAKKTDLQPGHLMQPSEMSAHNRSKPKAHHRPNQKTYLDSSRRRQSRYLLPQRRECGYCLSVGRRGGLVKHWEKNCRTKFRNQVVLEDGEIVEAREANPRIQKIDPYNIASTQDVARKDEIMGSDRERHVLKLGGTKLGQQKKEGKPVKKEKSSREPERSKIKDQVVERGKIERKEDQIIDLTLDSPPASTSAILPVINTAKPVIPASHDSSAQMKPLLLGAKAPAKVPQVPAPPLTKLLAPVLPSLKPAERAEHTFLSSDDSLSCFLAKRGSTPLPDLVSHSKEELQRLLRSSTGTAVSDRTILVPSSDQRKTRPRIKFFSSSTGVGTRSKTSSSTSVSTAPTTPDPVVMTSAEINKQLAEMDELLKAAGLISSLSSSDTVNKIAS